MFVVIAKPNKLQEDTVLPACFEYKKKKKQPCITAALFIFCFHGAATRTRPNKLVHLQSAFDHG